MAHPKQPNVDGAVHIFSERLDLAASLAEPYYDLPEGPLHTLAAAILLLRDDFETAMDHIDAAQVRQAAEVRRELETVQRAGARDG